MTKREFLRWLGASLAVGSVPGLLAGPGAGMLSSAQATDTAVAAIQTGIPQVRIHEWGTFTSLQDMKGQSVGGINVDVEALPNFVYNDYRGHIRQANAISTRLSKAGSAYTGPNRSVTMRLETPVLYVHGDADELLQWRLGVGVRFSGGRLSQYFPWAQVSINDGFEKTTTLCNQSQGSLYWQSLRMSKKADLPHTDLDVWLAPRKVDALDLTLDEDDVKPSPKPLPDGGARSPDAPLKEGDPRSERYLFYRGIGSQQDMLKTQLRETRAMGGEGKPGTGDCTLSIAVAKSEMTAAVLARSVSGECRIPALWLVNVREDGALAWKPVPGFSFKAKDIAPVGESSVTATDRTESFTQVATKFEAGDYTPAHAASLRVAMRDALVQDGLNLDEAEAMLATWDAAYFKTPGLRLFYITPKEWADVVLPLNISLVQKTGRDTTASPDSRHTVPAAAISRSMIARIELVTPEMQSRLDLVAKISQEEVQTALDLINVAVKKEPAMRAAMDAPAHHGPHPCRAIAGLPRAFVAYLDLGRFRDALLASIVPDDRSGSPGAQFLYDIVRN